MEVEVVKKDMVVILDYTVRLSDGSYVKGENGPVSLNFIVGYTQILPALERRLLGLRMGEKTEFIIPAAEAFGEYDPEQLKTRTFEDFPNGRDMQAGKWVIATSTDMQAQYSFFVKDKTETAVIADFNHPLAGKDLYYRVEITGIRPADDEELEFIRPCENGPEDGDTA